MRVPALQKVQKQNDGRPGSERTELIIANPGTRIQKYLTTQSGARWHAVKKVNDPGLQAVLRSDDEQPGAFNQVFQNCGPVAQVIGSSADIGTHCVRDQRIGLLCQCRGKQRFHGGTNSIDDRTDIG